MPQTRSRLLTANDGATAVEFALVVYPFLMLALAFLQFVFLHYSQTTLSDALFGIASQPSTLAVPGTAADYKLGICSKNAFTTNCTGTIKLERFKLANVPTAATAVAGTTWEGVSGDIVVLRAQLPTLSVVGFIPTLNARESVIFRLP